MRHGLLETDNFGRCALDFRAVRPAAWGLPRGQVLRFPKNRKFSDFSAVLDCKAAAKLLSYMETL